MKRFLLIVPTLFLLTACGGAAGDASPTLLGKPDAPILVEEFSDPQCPACSVVSPQLEQVIRDNPGLARLEYYHFPLSQHQYAFPAAEAVQCAGDQGKFFEYLDTIFKTQVSLSEDHLYKVADSLGLDRESFDACIDERKYKSKVLAHLAEGSRRRIPGTPTIFVNGQMVRWSDAATFKAYLESLVD